ncbi:Phospholipase D/Transphosphatidylase [Penicillium taxi]|uniref:Phospholipase D/Transphosphatidylase n=1 Tax=Penicillium taxi TaxID=168475 RepID=UPI0025450D30|nr:Phospholipase D/Transphosphatidylase [Penicillium taxi]KAJ5894676.1 Phospholipase D/Transphosphatidylase [Penicillium taxi]
MSQQNNDLAYGGYYEAERGSDGSRGLSDTFKKFRDTYGSYSGSSNQGHEQYQNQNQSPNQNQNQGQNQAPQYGYNDQNAPPPNQYQQRPHKEDKIGGFLDKIQDVVTNIGSEFATKLGTAVDPQAYAQYGTGGKPATENRFGSFAPPREHNDVKWYVDGCNYFWAVSRALETARESVWILDWWLSPELYLRRPPAKNEQYRLDRMLQAAAQRGVKVNIVVYKEVPQAVSTCSEHTKKALESLHPNIAVFRHPDHIPVRQEVESDIADSLQHMSLHSGNLAKMSGDALKAIYGINDDVVLFWAHHEKLCMIDGQIAFMGGLDLCYGRWDTHQHSISDEHPSDASEIVFPGQDYNNSRVLDFQDLANWQNNKLDRKEISRMGWSDISVSLRGAVVEDLRRHFVERWNFIYDLKYKAENNTRYGRIELYGRPGSANLYPSGYASPQNPQPPSQQYPPQVGGVPGVPGVSTYPPPPSQTQIPQQPASSYQTYHAETPPPYQGNTSSYPTHEKPAANYQASSPAYPSQAPTQYTYTGNSFPPPPPGAPPAASPSSEPYQIQQQGQSSYYPSAPTQHSDSSDYQGQGQTQAQSSYYPAAQDHSQGQGSYYPSAGEQHQTATRGLGDNQYESDRSFVPRRIQENLSSLRGQLAGQIHQYQDRLTTYGRPGSAQTHGNISCQIVRSCAKWSNGSPVEHSIADAYAAIIKNSERFVYIENQFFITATGNSQEPVKNQIGAAIVERILRAARAGEKYKIMVVIPSVPCFAGDLRDDSMLGTRAIMEFQYNSINRGGHSIMELIAKEGFNPMDYIRFYNLRNYDRINNTGAVPPVNTTAPDGYAPNAGHSSFDTSATYQQSPSAAYPAKAAGPGNWDSVSSCYMLGGEDIRNVPWTGHPDAEIDAFVSEELYVHSKVMIADDRVVICGSANLNDRSQLGDHDSEIAVIIEDFNPVHSRMNGQPWTASRFATSLRRELHRKHLGLLAPQDYSRPEQNSEPVGVPNQWDFDSPESQIVSDPLSDTFQSLWNSRARNNTEVFRKVFRAVPDDSVRNWSTYKELYEYYFHKADDEAGGDTGFGPKARYQWGHVVRDDFAPGPDGVKQVKEHLSQVKGTLVEMPLMFLIEEDVAKTGLALNDITEPIYT